MSDWAISSTTKMICIHLPVINRPNLIIGKVYDVRRTTLKDGRKRFAVKTEINSIFISDDNGSMFIPLADWREQQIDSILNDE